MLNLEKGVIEALDYNLLPFYNSRTGGGIPNILIVLLLETSEISLH